MKEEQRKLLQQTDKNIALIKKQLLSGKMVIDKDMEAVIAMFAININEISSIAKLVVSKGKK